MTAQLEISKCKTLLEEFLAGRIEIKIKIIVIFYSSNYFILSYN
jgi:hypothetical protein